MPFRKGDRPNPHGRPKGSRNKFLVALELVGTDRAHAILETVIKKALAGDLNAAKLVLDRILPVRKGSPVRLSNLPPLQGAGDVPAFTAALIRAVTSGELTSEEGAALTTLVDCYREGLALTELTNRVNSLERSHGMTVGRPRLTRTVINGEAVENFIDQPD